MAWPNVCPRLSVARRPPLKRVLYYYVHLHPHGIGDHLRQIRRALTFQLAEQIRVSQDAVLYDLCQPRPELGRRKSRENLRIDYHDNGLLERADKILALR